MNDEQPTRPDDNALEWPKLGKTRPLSLYPICLLDGLLVGLVPFSACVMAFASGEQDVPRGILALLAAVTGGTLIASVGTFVGDELSRIGLQVMIVAYWTINLIVAVGVASASTEPIANVGAVAAVIKALLWISVNVWFLNKKDVVRYCAS